MTLTDGTDSSAARPSARSDAFARLSDGELLRLVRAGEDDADDAFGELFARHAGAARGFALRCCADVAEADDMAAEAFFRVFQAVRRGAGPDDNMRAYLMTVVRRLAAEWRARRRDVPVADDELGRQVDAEVPPPASGVDLQLIARAFTTLPWRWRAVLWRVEVEGERPAVVARHFGLSANATAALARRARQGLRAAYLQAHLAPAGGPHGCRSVVAKLGGFTAGQVTGIEADRIARHLAGCAQCRALHAELLDVCAGLRRYAQAAPVAVSLGLRFGHGALGQVVGKFAGKGAVHAAAAGARLKLVATVLSMAAVGGVAAGPFIGYLSPSPEVNRGVAVGPLLTVAPAPAPSSIIVVPHRIIAAFVPTMRAEVRGAAPPPRNPITVIVRGATGGPQAPPPSVTQGDPSPVVDQRESGVSGPDQVVQQPMHPQEDTVSTAAASPAAAGPSTATGTGPANRATTAGGPLTTAPPDSPTPGALTGASPAQPASPSP